MASVSETYKWAIRRSSPCFRSYMGAQRSGYLVGTICSACGRVYVPSRFACGQCGGRTTMEWVSLGPHGVVDGFDVVHFVPATLKGRIAKVPWIAAIVRLEGGGYIKTFLEGSDPGDVHRNMRVRLVWKDGELHHCERAESE